MTNYTKIESSTGQRHRNTADMIDAAEPSFDAAHMQGIMALYAQPGPGRTVTLGFNDQPVIDFVRCSYLGLDNHPSIVEAAAKAVRDDGALHWSCARTRLNFKRLGELEDQLSELFQARVLTFSTVLAANMSALPLLASGHLTNGKKPVMVFDRFAHATLAYHKAVAAEETAVETIGHNDIEALEALCKAGQPVAYICDGIYSMGGQADLSALRVLQEKYGLFLYIDDAHGVSVFGESGSGFARTVFDPLNERTIVATSLGKGFGASGGLLMIGSARQELLLRRFAIAHAFSASMTVAAIGAAAASAQLHSTDELQARQSALADNLALFDRLIETRQKHARHPIRMLPVGDELQSIDMSRRLVSQGFYVSAVFFPTVARGHAGLRLCLTASHREDDIHRFRRVLDTVQGSD